MWVEHRGHRVIWVPVGVDSPKKRLLVCAHLEGAGHRGVDATMARLERHCVWGGMDDDVRDMIRPVLCGHQGGCVGAPYAGRNPSLARAERSVVHFDLLYMGESAADAGNDAADGFSMCWSSSKM